MPRNELRKALKTAPAMTIWGTFCDIVLHASTQYPFSLHRTFKKNAVFPKTALMGISKLDRGIPSSRELVPGAELEPARPLGRA
jgi:hypothetical protein